MPVAEPNVTGQLLVLAGPVVADADVPPVALIPPADVVPPVILLVLTDDEPPVGLLVLEADAPPADDVVPLVVEAPLTVAPPAVDELPPRLSIDVVLGCPELLQPAAARTRY